jgi:hypothetical protein
MGANGHAETPPQTAPQTPPQPPHRWPHDGGPRGGRGPRPRPAAGLRGRGPRGTRRRGRASPAAAPPGRRGVRGRVGVGRVPHVAGVLRAHQPGGTGRRIRAAPAATFARSAGLTLSAAAARQRRRCPAWALRALVWPSASPCEGGGVGGRGPTASPARPAASASAGRCWTCWSPAPAGSTSPTPSATRPPPDVAGALDRAPARTAADAARAAGPTPGFSSLPGAPPRAGSGQGFRRGDGAAGLRPPPASCLVPAAGGRGARPLLDHAPPRRPARGPTTPDCSRLPVDCPARRAPARKCRIRNRRGAPAGGLHSWGVAPERTESAAVPWTLTTALPPRSHHRTPIALPPREGAGRCRPSPWSAARSWPRSPAFEFGRCVATQRP